MKSATNLPVSGKQPNKSSAAKSLVAGLIFIAAGIFIFLYGGIALDWLRALQFTPSSAVARAESRIAFTGRGEQIFYATAPAIEDKEQFNQSCASTERTVAILGCYVDDKIYLYNIQNQELDGTLEVTAAHEMLHAAYHRLNYFERQRVDELIRAKYEEIKNTPEIKQVMEYYSKAEPGAELDELHSIIGTTIIDLPAELESYYAQYFTDRAVVVKLNAKYSAVFGALSRQADELQKQIDIEGPAVHEEMVAYQSDLHQLNLDIQSFNARATSGGFSTQNEFATAQVALEQRVQAMNVKRAKLNMRVDAYNALIDNLNKLAVHVNRLNESMNGVDAPSGVN